MAGSATGGQYSAVSSPKAGGASADSQRGRTVPSAPDDLLPDLFREAMANWASSVLLCATRDASQGRVIATTATSFAPVAASPPTVLVSLSPNAQVLPFVEPGRPLGLSVLEERQGRWASVFADSFPVGTPDWEGEHAPVLPGACIGLECTVGSVHEAAGAARLVVGRVVAVHERPGRPLLYHRRRYTRLSEDAPANFRRSIHPRPRPQR